MEIKLGPQQTYTDHKKGSVKK